ncbi:MAG: potassium transporter TrkG, partial [Alphaproteobacteria bacterium]
MSFAPIFAFLGRLLALFAVAMLLPAAVALGYGEERDAYVFGATASVTLFFGVGMVFASQGAKRRIRRRGDLLLAIISWPLLAAFAAAPFYLLDAVDTPVDAFFEALSGLTTTGATVMSGLDELGRGLVFWRAWLQWLGGLGT